ncbi:MAG TPA: hypothetical protein VNO52_01795, partial [Methylomirabilota bacterium]|nr:hypothetical protein [Methylomirabilota bacterium]
GSCARLEARGAILMGGGGASNFRDELGPSHRDEQPVLLLSDGARAALTNCYIINTAGQVGNGLNADVTYDHCLIQRAITAGEYEGGTVIVNHSALIEFPADNGEVDATIADSDYDGIYFTTGTHILLNSLLGFAKDDAIDSGSGGAGTVVVSNCWVESALHEALAWSGGGRQTWTYDTVVMNCGQGIECGWSEGGGVSPDCFAERLLSIGNSVGARFGDNYDWTYNGFLRVTNSLLLHNYRDIWGLNWDDWTYRVAQMDLRGNWTSTVNTNHPENVLWNPAAHASRLAPYLTAPPGAPVGIGFAVWPHEAPAALLTNGIPVRLSCFTTHPVSVEYAVQTQAGEVESGSLTFQPGETVRHIRVQTGGLINEDLARVVLRRPTGGELTGTSSFFIARPPPPVTPSSTTLIPTGATWKYADFGTDQGAAWRLLSFNDTTWPSGPAELGNGDGDEMTRINIGPSGARYPTVYFRRRFVVENPSVFESLLIRMKCDDGGIVWINNQPVFRQNMPADPINYSTYTGRSTPSETAYFSNVVSAVVLTPGTNICAVEVHQGDAGSSDLSFDLGLVGIGRPPAPPLHLRALGSDHVLLWNAPGFVLERSTGLPGNWVPVAGATSPYVIPRRSGNQFFRLHRP